jgi:hypothetical protein
MYEPKQRLMIPVAFDLSGSVAAFFTWKFATKKSLLILDIRAIYTEASVPASTPGVLSVGYDALTAGSEVEKAVITSGANAIGAEVGPDTAITPFVVSPTDTLYFRLKTQASGGTTTGAGYIVVEYADQPL